MWVWVVALSSAQGPEPPRRRLDPTVQTALAQMHDLYCKERGHMDRMVCALYYAKRGATDHTLILRKQPPSAAEINDMHETYCTQSPANMNSMLCKRWVARKLRPARFRA